MIRWTLLVVLTIWAIWPKSYLRNFLLALLVYNVTLEICVLSGYGETTILYHWLYYLLTGVILVTILELTLVYMQAHPWPWLLFLASSLLALVSFSLAYSGLAKPLHGYDRFMLLEATTLIFCGTGTGLASSFLSAANRHIATSLAILWILLSCFRYGFNLNLPQASWLRLNLWLPYWLGCSEFLYLGWKLRKINAATGRTRYLHA
jgi:hypothetical protein